MRAAATILLLAFLTLAQQQPPARTAAPPKPAPKPAAAPSPESLQFPPLSPVAIPRIESATLPNGIKLFLLEDHELPLVSVLALVRTGNLFDPPDKIGLATITGAVLRSGGTKTLTGDELDERLENVAATVESRIDETFGSVSFSALKQDAAQVLEIFRDLLTAPEFREDKIELIKGQLRSSISRRNDDPARVASREFLSLLYGRDTPYGAVMEYDHLDHIARADLVAFHQRYYFPANILLAVRGDFPADAMRAQIEKLFGSWSHTQPPVPPFPEVKSNPAPGLYLGEKKDAANTFFAIGHLGGMVRDPDFAALQLLTEVLGGGFNSRLFQRLRTSMGAAYAIAAAWNAAYNHPGRFEVSGSTKALSTFDTIRVVRDEIARLAAEEVSAAELEHARARVLNSFVFNFDTKAKSLNRLLTYEYYGYPKDFIEQYHKTVAAVTRADLLQVAKERLKPDQLVVVAIGRPADFGRPPATLNLSATSLNLSIKEPRAPRAPADAESLKRGNELLQSVQTAVGGAGKMEAIQDIVEISEFDIDPAFGGMKVKQTDRWIRTGQFRQESQFPFGLISAFWDGKTGWLVTPQGAGALPALQRKQVEGEMFRIFIGLLLSDRIPGRVVNYAEGAIEITGPGDQYARLAIDGKTGLPQSLRYLSTPMSGPPVPVEETYTEYTEVGGLKLPSRVSITQAGRRFGEVRIVEYRFNTGLQPAELAKRP
jgi:zinc protease